MAPDARIVYVDNDPLVLAHARADTLDLTQPVALMLMNVLGHIGGIDEAQSIVWRLLDGLPSGSTWRSATAPM